MVEAEQQSEAEGIAADVAAVITRHYGVRA
jgi:hypothetical protein